jgi:acyl-CoA reductase-like NAD-dependent aldehyde dehydrogenase
MFSWMTVVGPVMNSITSNVGDAVAPLIDGVISESECDTLIEVINPSDGQRCFSMSAGSERDVDRAVASSRYAFETGHWSDESPSVRKRALHRLADLIEAHAPLFDALDAVEMGKPVSEVLYSASDAASLMRFYAEAVDKLSGDSYPSDKYSFVTERRLPRGVVAAIVAWNFPTYNAVLKVAPALAAGNCVVLKPSELSSRSAIRLGWLALQAGVPPGVLNVVPGLGETVGRFLGLHRGVDAVAFTGSTEVGKLMLTYAGSSNMKVVMAECGGKCPQIVFDDGVDLDAVSASIAKLLLTNQGQICSVGSRLLVQRSIDSAVSTKVSARMREIVMGNALDPKTTFGPLVSAKQCARVMQYIQIGQAEGAQLVTGGNRVLQQSGGYFVEPTIFSNVMPSARIAQEEIFGPVLTVIPFADEVEALRIANGTMYGLAAYVWTASLSRGMRMARGIRSSVIVNEAAPVGEGAGHAAAWEPTGQSGIGVEGGLAGMETYLRRQLVWFNHA